MRKCMLIGGGDTGRGDTLYETKEIDEEIVKMTEKENPTFLFIGLASSHSDSKYDNMKKIYKELGCTTLYLKRKNLIHNPDLGKEKIEQADIIYICGGDTIKLLKDVEEFHLEPLLKAACERGCVMAGSSAGAILLADSGFSDARILRGESDTHEFLKGLGLVDINICPHYHENSKKTEELQEILKKTKKEVYGIENCTALKIIEQEKTVIRSKKEKNIYICTYKGKYQEEKI